LSVASMLELFSLQRHDFLNHLQVISGLIQLHKEEQAREYIRKVAQDIKRLRGIVHLGIPEAAAALLLFHHRAAERQIAVDYDVRSDLAACPVPGSKLGEIIELVLQHVAACLAAAGESGGGRLSVSIDEAEGGGAYRLCFSFAAGASACGWDDAASRTAAELRRLGGELEKATAGERHHVILSLPKHSG